MKTQKNKSLDVTKINQVTAFEAGESLYVNIFPQAITSDMTPMYGFDQVTFTIFIADSSSSGCTVLPYQHENTPHEFSWNYEILLGGWNKAMFKNEFASNQCFGGELQYTPEHVVDKENQVISLKVPKDKVGNPESFEGWRIYVTTCHYDGMTSSFLPVLNEDQSTTYVIDAFGPVVVSCDANINFNELPSIKKLEVEDIDFKIIDTHTHIGVLPGFDMTCEKFLNYIDNYKIDLSIISNLGGVEFDREAKKLSDEYYLSQIEANTAVLNLAKMRPNKIKALFWVKPFFESFDEEAKDFMLAHANYFRGFKFHAFHSQLGILDDKLKPYLEFSNEHKLSILFHTDRDDVNNEYSRPKYVYELAKRYPDANFIMAHLGMTSDGKAAATYISKLPNLYGDIAQCNTEVILNAIDICGSQKILYATDATINDSVDIYPYYLSRIQTLKERLSTSDFENIMFKNAESLFL